MTRLKGCRCPRGWPKTAKSDEDGIAREHVHTWRHHTVECPLHDELLDCQHVGGKGE